MKSLSVSTHPSQSTGAAGPIVSLAEAERMAAVDRYAILDTPPEGAFDRITRLAAQLFDVPIAIVSIVDHDRIWFKSAHGLQGVSQISREPGLCSSAIENDAAYVVERADTDPRCNANSLVSGPLGLRFYVGVPLATSDGYNLGTLCVIDSVPRSADALKVEMLTSLAKIVVDELELRLAARRIAFESDRREIAEAAHSAEVRRSLTDVLTGLENRRALDDEIDRLFAEFQGGVVHAGSIVLIDVDGLKTVNDRRGHDIGDRFLRTFSLALTCAFPDQRVFRCGGDEFVILTETEIPDGILREAIAGVVRSVVDDGFPETGASFGAAAFADVDGSPRGALRLADSRMYAAKVGRR